MMENRKVTRCPECGKEAPIEGNLYRPFCSRRCKLMDLGSWLAEEYTISSPITDRDIPLETTGKKEADP